MLSPALGRSLALFVALSFFPLSSAVPLSSRQPFPLSGALSIASLDALDALYRSSPTYRCPAALFAISGGSFPVRVEAVALKVDAPSPGERGGGGTAIDVEVEAVASIANGWTKPFLGWAVDEALKLEEDTLLAVRVTDSDGAVAYSPARKVREGDGDACKKLTSTTLDFFLYAAAYLLLAAVFAFMALMVYSLVWTVSLEERARAGRWPYERGNEGDGPLAGVWRVVEGLLCVSRGRGESKRLRSKGLEAGGG
ncbi:hypothetical protein JCM6882_005467 [Rhodosporidiobolus microsporus]